MSTVFRHPGYLGWTSKGILLIHADWPAYAVEHGLGYSLLNLGQFPRRTRFTLLDDIDQCFLFIVGDRPRPTEHLPESRFYVALWHEDVADLANRGYVLGATEIPYRDWAKQRAAELVRMHWQRPDETWAPFPLPDPDDFEDTEVVRTVVSSDGLVLIESGYQALEALLLAERDQIDEALMQRARPAIRARLYDSAVREACVVVETTMRSAVGNEAYGMRLIDDFFGMTERSNRFISAQLKTFRTEVRSTFKFVRNEYVHSLQAISRTECYALLVRLSNVYAGVADLSGVLKSGG